MKKIFLQKRLKFSLFFASFLIFALPLFSLEVPPLTNPVVDKAGIVSLQTENSLNAYLSQLSSQTGIQVAVLTIPSLENESLEEFSMQVCEKWKLGNKEKDTGVLLLVSLEERAVRIEVGYGLEGVLTDLNCGMIIRNVIAPYFRSGNYDEGISKAVENIVGFALGDESLISENVTEQKNTAFTVLPGIFSFIIFIIMMNVLLSTKQGRRLLLFMHLTNNMNSSNRNFPSSFGGGSSFRGGGGGFGGGGASGHW